MQAARLLQAAILMMVLAMAASCATGKEYTARIFGTRPVPVKDSQELSVTFLDLDSAVINNNDWVTTDMINGKEKTNTTQALDNLSQVFPAGNIPDSARKSEETKALPVAKSSIIINGTRSKTIRE